MLIFRVILPPKCNTVSLMEDDVGDENTEDVIEQNWIQSVKT